MAEIELDKDAVEEEVEELEKDLDLALADTQQALIQLLRSTTQLVHYYCRALVLPSFTYLSF